MAEGGGLLNRYRVVKPYRGFESLRLRQFIFVQPGDTSIGRGESVINQLLEGRYDAATFVLGLLQYNSPIDPGAGGFVF